MGLHCSVCRLPAAGAINEALRLGRSARTVATEFGLSYDALTRHARNHLSPRPPSTPKAAGDPLDELVVALRVRALAGDAAAAREYRLALAAQAAARHAAAPRRDLAVEPEWISLRTAILVALEPFAEARLAVADALGGS